MPKETSKDYQQGFSDCKTTTIFMIDLVLKNVSVPANVVILETIKSMLEKGLPIPKYTR